MIQHENKNLIGSRTLNYISITYKLFKNIIPRHSCESSDKEYTRYRSNVNIISCIIWSILLILWFNRQTHCHITSVLFLHIYLLNKFYEFLKHLTKCYILKSKRTIQRFNRKKFNRMQNPQAYIFYIYIQSTFTVLHKMYGFKTKLIKFLAKSV